SRVTWANCSLLRLTFSVAHAIHQHNTRSARNWQEMAGWRRRGSVGKQEAQVVQREALGKLLLAEHVGHQRVLLLLEGADLLLDAFTHQQAVGHHFAGLADAVRAV